jgi:hypothetical protein
MSTVCTCTYDDEGNLLYRNKFCAYAGHGGQDALAGSAAESTTSAPASNRKLYIGLFLGLLLYVLLRGGSVALATAAQGTNTQAYWALDLPTAMSLLALVILIAAIVLIFFARTRKLGAGRSSASRPAYLSMVLPTLASSSPGRRRGRALAPIMSRVQGTRCDQETCIGPRSWR